MAIVYQHNPRPVGGGVTFLLEGSKLTVNTGLKRTEIPLSAIDHVRMTYEPGRVAQKNYRSRIRLKDGTTFAFSSLTWRGLVEAVEQGPEYRAFLKALFEGILLANPKARFVAGKPWPIWALTMFVGIGALGGITLLAWRAYETDAIALAIIGTLFAGLGMWQIEPMVRLNMPRPLNPRDPPPELLPRSA